MFPVYDWFIPFITSAPFIGLIALLTILYIVKYYENVYANRRKIAARIILSEVRYAEKSIEEIAHRLTNYLYGEYPSVLPTNSWKQYREEFVVLFDQDEIDLMNNFYATCAAIEDFVRRERDIFWTNAKAKSGIIQKNLADAVMRSYQHGAINRKVLEDYKKLVLDVIARDEYDYIPRNATRVLDSYVIHARRISDSTAYQKLKGWAKEE